MNIPLLIDNEIEDEIGVNWHCSQCAEERFGISNIQAHYLNDKLKNDLQIEVPNSVLDSTSFMSFISLLKVSPLQQTILEK